MTIFNVYEGNDVFTIVASSGARSLQDMFALDRNSGRNAKHVNNAIQAVVTWIGLLLTQTVLISHLLDILDPADVAELFSHKKRAQVAQHIHFDLLDITGYTKVDMGIPNLDYNTSDKKKGNNNQKKVAGTRKNGRKK
jgi:hypothetical protein